MADGIKLRLGRGDMNVFRTDDRVGERVRVHVAGRHPAALCPSCAHPSVETNGTGWRDVIDVVRTLVVTLSICVRRFVCANEDCAQRSFDERFEGIGRGGASERALGFFADLARAGPPPRWPGTWGCRPTTCTWPWARAGAGRRTASPVGWGLTWPSTSAPSSATTSMPRCSPTPAGAWSSTWRPAGMERPSPPSPAATGAGTGPRWRW